jgi:HEPN domain-containing protein
MSGREPAAVARHWLDLARGELAAAREISANPRLPPRVAVGLAHQAAEKALKARIASLGSDPPRTHDLVDLARRIRWTTSLDADDARLGALSDAYVESRYPTYHDVAYDRDEAAEFVAVATSIVSQMERELGQD